MPTYETVGVVRFVSADTGERTGCIDVCRQNSDAVVVRLNSRGHEAIVQVSPATARRVADLLAKAAASDEAPDATV